MHELSQYTSELPTVDDWLAGDDRALVFQVVDGDGTAVDITGATVEWGLFERPYESDAGVAVLSEADSDVELVTDNRVNLEEGVWEVRVDGDATASLWGEYYQRPRVEQTDGSVASWRGEVVLEA
jgi:nitrogen fixation protein FixH